MSTSNTTNPSDDHPPLPRTVRPRNRLLASAHATLLAALLLCAPHAIGQDIPPTGTAPEARPEHTSLLLGGLTEAARLLCSLDPEVVDITLRSLQISGTATLISLILGIAMSLTIALNTFPGKRLLISLINTGMGMPPVVIGLLVSIMLWRSGPLGSMALLYTPTAIVIAQILIATPIITAISLAALQNLPSMLRLQILALGASRRQMVWMLVREARLPILAAVMAGFGGIISEVGASMMVGGNIKGQTRVLTTATVLETSKGNFETAIAFGIILLLLAFTFNLILTRIQQRERPR